MAGCSVHGRDPRVQRVRFLGGVPMSAQGFRSMTWLIVIELFAVALLWRCCSSTADAQGYGAKVASEEGDGADQLKRLPVPAEQWTPRAHLWLSRAMVAEAGWVGERDHRGLAFVLARRWRRAVRRFPSWRFVDQVREYCSALGGGRRSLSPRQVWLRGLAGELQPNGWPANALWSNHVPLWRDVLARAHRWARGELRDPCRGRAVAWGGDMDDPSDDLVEVDCGETANTFYRLRGAR